MHDGRAQRLGLEDDEDETRDVFPQFSH